MKKKKTFIFKNLTIWTNTFLILLWLNEKEAYTTYAAIKVKWMSRWKSTHVITAQAKPSLLGGTLFLFEGKKKNLIGKLLIIQIQVHGKYFLKNKPSEPITSRKIQILSGTHDKIQAFKWKFKFSKISVTINLITYQYLKLKTVLIILVVILTNVIFLWKLCHYSVN